MATTRFAPLNPPSKDSGIAVVLFQIEQYCILFTILEVEVFSSWKKVLICVPVLGAMAE